jgi:uncharacterized protein YpmS
MQAPNNVVETLRNNVPNAEQISEGVGNAINTVSSTVEAAKESINSSLNAFSSQSAVNGSEEFLNSNTMIAKFVFLLLVVIAFLLLVALGMKIIAFFIQPSRTPYLVKGKITGASDSTISQTPNSNTDPIVFRSNNKSNGMELTWSVWLTIDSVKNSPTYNHVFNKGNDDYDTTTGVATVNNAPGVYLKNDSGSPVLRVYMDAVERNDVYVDIQNIPLKKWFHLAVRIKNNIMDIYINGSVAQRHVFTSVPKQNYNDVLVGKNGGFNGYLSNLLYYDRALNVYEINNIILGGPNVSELRRNVPLSNLGYYSYLSRSWYTS